LDWLSENSNITNASTPFCCAFGKSTWEIIQNNLDKKLNWLYISRNPNITWEIIQDNLDKEWNWEEISINNPNITWEIIQNNPEYPWVWKWISIKSYITWEIIQNNPDKFNNWGYISSNPNITWEIIQNNPDKAWNYYEILCNSMEVGKIEYMKKNIQRDIKIKFGKKILPHIFNDENIIEYICAFL